MHNKQKINISGSMRDIFTFLGLLVAVNISGLWKWQIYACRRDPAVRTVFITHRLHSSHRSGVARKAETPISLRHC